MRSREAYTICFYFVRFSKGKEIRGTVYLGPGYQLNYRQVYLSVCIICARAYITVCIMHASLYAYVCNADVSAILWARSYNIRISVTSYYRLFRHALYYVLYRVGSPKERIRGNSVLTGKLYCGAFVATHTILPGIYDCTDVTKHYTFLV